MYLVKQCWNSWRAAWKRMQWADREALLFAICDAKSLQMRTEAWLDLQRRGPSNWDLVQVILRSEGCRLRTWAILRERNPSLDQLLWIVDQEPLCAEVRQALKKMGLSDDDIKCVAAKMPILRRRAKAFATIVTDALGQVR